MSEVVEVEALEGQSRRKTRPVLLGILALLFAILLLVWTQRGPIASGFIDRELARRGVQARYEVERVGFGTERLTNVVLGNPMRPDLVARMIEIRLGWTLSGPEVVAIKARGVRLHGRLAGGKLDLGQVDRLLPKSSGGPFRLPDQYVDLADTGLRLESDWGAASIAIEGKGNLANGFRGMVALVSREIRTGACAARSLRANMAVAVERQYPQLTGPLDLASFSCGSALGTSAGRIDLDARLAPALDRWTGSASVDLARLRASTATADRLTGTIQFGGNADQLSGRLAVTGQKVRVVGNGAAQLALSGPYSIAPATGRITFAGEVRAEGASLASTLQAPQTRALNGLGGTPLAPFAKSWSSALSEAGRAFDGEAALHLASESGTGGLRVGRLAIRSASGARLTLAGGNGLEYLWPRGRLRIDGNLALAGGGLPSAAFTLRQGSAGGPISGNGRIAPVSAGGARLALGEIRFAEAAGGTRIDTIARFDGPFQGGRVNGLEVPVRARIKGDGSLLLGESCTTIAFQALQTGTLRLGPTRLPLCPTGPALVWKRGAGQIAGGASLAKLRLGGRLGSAPIAIAAERLRLSLRGPAFTAGGIAIRLGPPGGESALDIAGLTAGKRGSGLGGTYSGLSGKLSAVPLRVSEGKGVWQLRGTDLDADGALVLSDALDPPRFYPLVSRDFHLGLADNRIEARGGLSDPKSGTHIADARISHDLGTGRGRALLDMPGIKFDPAYQPEQLTRLTVGVVALVNGTLKGQGEIAWDGSRTTSSGTFTTENMNLAASFGPVEGLSTSLHFTDLLGLVSAPGQIATAKLIRTGVDVFDGRIAYRILPELKVEVEEGRWPFAGGELLLDRTILDFMRPTPKLLTFRLTGMDAARFVSQMEFSNINATGTFDGVVPMVFDDRGGRIEGGHLVARDPGGTLSYVGELTDKDLGVYGKLAFDALKSLRYSKLIVDLDGALEGEFIAGIQLDGIARDVAAAPERKGGISAMVVGRALGQLAKIPFKFNISVRGPFRAVIGTARSLQDPTDLIQTVLPQMLRDKPVVQPKESEPVR